jgi:hypothetical protein
MRLTLDPRRLQPDLLQTALAAMVPDEGFRQQVREAEAVPAASAFQETPVVEGWARTVDWNRVDVVVVVGLGSGLVIDVIQSRSKAFVLVLEPRSSVVKAVLSTRALPRRQVTLHRQVVGIRADLRLRCLKGSRVMLFAPPWAREELPELAEEAQAAIDEAHSAVTIQDNTLRLHGERFNDVVLESFRHIVGNVTANAMGGALQGVPGVVVSAGPSLDKNVRLLKELEGRAAICAMNSSLSALDAQQVQADLLTMLEIQNITGMIKASPSLQNLVLMPALQTHLGIYELPRKALMPAVVGMNGGDRWLASVLNLPELTAGGSVACLAFSLLAHLGCNPIILVGQDCALAEDRMYASGTPLADMRMETHGTNAVRQTSQEPFLRLLDDEERAQHDNTTHWVNRLVVTAWGGEGEVHTTGPLECYRSWFEEQAPLLSHRVRLINATEGGAHIAGFEEIPLAQVLDQLPQQRVEVVERLRARAHDEAPLDADFIARELRKEALACHRNLELAYDAGRCVRKLLRLFGPRQSQSRANQRAQQRELARLAEYETKTKETELRSLLLRSAVLVEMQRIRHEAVSMNPATPDEGRRQSLEQSRQIFQEMATAAAALKPKLENLAAKLEGEAGSS